MHTRKHVGIIKGKTQFNNRLTCAWLAIIFKGVFYSSESLMNTPKDQTNEIIRQAYQEAARGFFINKKAEAELFSRLSFITETNAIPSLLPLVFCNNKRLADAVAHIIHKIVIKMTADDWEALDVMIRNVDYYSNPLWNQIAVNQIKSLDFEKPVSNSIYALLCSHHNGYVREQAMKGLFPEFSELNIPVLLIRANDWVDNIKRLADAKLIEFIDDINISHFIPSLNLIAQLYRKERYDHSILINTIEGQLIEKCYDKLLLTLASPLNRKISRIAFRIAAKCTSKIPQLIQVSSQSRDIIIKLETLNVASQHLSDDILFEFLGGCLEDKSPIIRRKCVHICLQKFPKQINHILLNTLFDKSFSLRELARFYLKNSDNNIGKIYQEALINKNKPLNITIMGLAEVGNRDDFKLLEPYMHGTVLTIKAACIYAIFKLKPDNQQKLILDQLPSSVPAILKAICEGLNKNSGDFDIDSIEKVFCQQGDLYSNMLFIKMKIALIKDRWSLIDYMLDHVRKVDNDKVKLFIEHNISRWIVANSPNKVFTKPKRDLLLPIIAKVDQLILQDNNAHLYNALEKSIRFFIE